MPSNMATPRLISAKFNQRGQVGTGACRDGMTSHKAVIVPRAILGRMFLLASGVSNIIPSAHFTDEPTGGGAGDSGSKCEYSASTLASSV